MIEYLKPNSKPLTDSKFHFNAVLAIIFFYMNTVIKLHPPSALNILETEKNVNE